ncbi:MAG: GDP-mannose 4,6-dehydratase [Patescibacteria group bacterium]
MKKTTQKTTQRTILITGAAGFIGSNVLEYLFNKYTDTRFIVLDALTYAGNFRNFSQALLKSPRFEFHYGDVRNHRLVEDLVSRSNIVIHFAAETHVTRSIHDNAKFFETDVLGTQAITNAVYHYQDKVERFLHISTCEVYGAGLVPKMDEDHPLNPHSPYAAAKAGADRLVYSYYVTYGTPVIILRPFNIFGPRQHLEKVIPRFITSAILGEPLTVHGDGKFERDFMYVEDIARAVDKLIHAPLKKVVGHVFNAGSGKAVSIVKIAKTIAEEMKLPNSQIIFVGDRPGQVSTFACNYKKMNRLVNWEPKKDFINGLRETIQWYKNNKDVWKDQLWLRSVPIITREGKTEYH